MSASAADGGVDGLGQLLGSGALEQEATGARLEGPVHVLVGVEGGDHHDGDWVTDLGSREHAGGLDAVEVRHPDVEQAHVGPQLAGERDRLTPVRGLADDLDARLVVEDRREVPGVGFAIDQTFLTLTTVYVLVPILMGVVSLLAPARINRVTNIAVSLTYAATVAVSVVGETWSYYILGSVVEVVLLAAVARVAWTWPRTSAAAGTATPVRAHVA